MNYTTITKEFTDRFFDLTAGANEIIITSHFAPDGDSISCVLSVYRILSGRYPDKKIRIVYSNERDDHFSYFENFEKIEWVTDVAEVVGTADLLICLDGGNLYRFTRYPEKLAMIKNTICIDHHASPPDTFTLSTIVPDMPSCSEVVYRLLADEITLDKNLAETFLLGILTDTGNFIFLNASQSDTFLIAKKLIDAGNININTLRSKYTSISEREFNLLQEFIKHTSFGKVEGWPPFVYTYAEREVIEKDQYTNLEISAATSAYIAGYITSLKNYSWGFIVKPKSSYCSVSMRSLPESVNVRDMLERMDLGGGHDRAAGGIFKKETDSKDPKICADQIIDWMKNDKPILN